MSQRQLTDKEKAQLKVMLATPRPLQLQGTCKGCNRGIPVGYLPMVTKWASVLWGSFRVAKPVEMFCKSCAGDSVPAPAMYRRKFPDPVKRAQATADEPEMLPLKEVAIKVYEQLTDKEPFNSKQLCKRTGLGDVYRDAIKTVLKKLQEAGRVQFEDGKWLRA